MSRANVRTFEYVNQPYEHIRDILLTNAAGILGTASKAAASRTGELAASLSVAIKGVEVSKDVTISIGAVREEKGPRRSPVTHVDLVWEAQGSPRLFPVMSADLMAYPLSATETQIDLRGHYDPPLGVLGDAIDLAVGHRVAEAAVHRFVGAVVERLRQKTSPP
jgi:hypothetical protein